MYTIHAIDHKRPSLITMALPAVSTCNTNNESEYVI